MVTVPVISSYVLQGLPAFVRREIGDEALQRANRAAGFDIDLIERQNCFIPQRAMMDFVDTIGREAGEPNLGLLIAPAMDVAAYGSFGRYVFGARTLRQAIKRSIAALRYHSTFDSLSVTVFGDELRYSYASALAGSKGYPAIATAAAGELLSLFRAYMRDKWRPLRIELDIETPHRISLFEDTFQCPVIFGRPAVAIVFARHHLTATSKCRSRPIVTIEDVARDWPGGAPQSLLQVTISQIHTQVLTRGVMIEDIARSMDTSVRSLQRELERAGTDFRSLTNAVKIQRATELLRHTGISITDVSAELGYSSPANFARAFRKATGAAPHEFRANRLQGD
ncbi:AraC family transcriptional regulator [Chelatococcus asaccharovorans]|uniref:AraC family transcriptional regulator n=1 Tax=Chelatococcus asaccharovorans TaxID=28210 RepID=UPI002265357F|nr:AraC family transcriptional regulator [Chelatococcus asaccharovorans]